MIEIIEQFINQIQGDQKLLENTKSAYRSDLNDLMEYVSNTKTQIQDINQNWVKDYLKHLESTNKERNSYNRRASTFRLFLRFLYKNKLAPTNYSLIVNNLTTFFKTQEDELQREDIKKIMEAGALRTTPLLKIDERIILLLIGKLGLTGTQIVSLNTFQIDFENKIINLSDTEKIELPREIFTVLREYLLEVRANLPLASENLSLFLDEKGRPVSEVDIYRLIKKLSEDLSLTGKLTTRNLKKSLENKNDILSMQREVFSVIAPD